MTAKEYLKQYERAVKKVKIYEDEYEQESILIDAVRSLSDNDGLPHGSGISKPTEEKAIRLADYRMRLIDAKLEAIEIRQKLFDFINSIEGVEGDVLRERYIYLRTWEEICVEINYSWRQTHRYHQHALSIVSHLLGIE